MSSPSILTASATVPGLWNAKSYIVSSYSAAMRGWLDWMIAQIFSGLAGMSRWRTPYSCRASTTALITAGGLPIAPTSPQPFHPKRVVGAERDLRADRHAREIVGTGHGIVHERTRDQLPLLIVDGVLEQRLADPLHDAPPGSALPRSWG